MRQRRQVVQRISFRFEEFAGLPIANASLYGNGFIGFIQRNHTVHLREANKTVVAVGNSIKRMTGSLALNVVVALDNGSKLVDRCGLVKIIGREFDIASPVFPG